VTSFTKFLSEMIELRQDVIAVVVDDWVTYFTGVFKKYCM